MLRNLYPSLITWKKDPLRMPLIIRGARQVGKTYLVQQFGEREFDHFVNINFELEPELKDCFTTLKPDEIISAIQFRLHTTITPGNTLLFLDEIQECPNAIMALRYFKEMLPELHVICATSLLEFALNDDKFRMPVGRVQYKYLKPLSFIEFLSEMGHQRFIDAICQSSFEQPLPEIAHQELLKLVRIYIIIGGMPAVVQAYSSNQNITDCQSIQTGLMATYRDDFGKYATKANHKYLRQAFQEIPQLVGKQVKYVDIARDMRPRDLKVAIEQLNYAGLIYPVFSSLASGLPLNALVDHKKFKCIMLDVGLMSRVTRINIETLLHDDLMLLNRGAFAEQFVGQELLAYLPNDEAPEILYWSRDKASSSAEIDYLQQIDDHIVPIEVKAGKTGTLKSLRLFMEEKDVTLGIRISQSQLALNKDILSIPLYMVSELERLLKEVIS